MEIITSPPLERKGILLAGGAGTRLHPATLAISKQLLPVYDKPMIYYPLSVLMLADIRDILIISTPQDTPRFQQLFGNGNTWGINLSYAVQESPRGIAQALVIADEFLAGHPSTLILGDNIFFGGNLSALLIQAKQRVVGSTIFTYRVHDPQRYGVAEIAPNGGVKSLEEKPLYPRSNYAVTGLYFYDSEASNWARELLPSPRGEFEITDLNRRYLENGLLYAQPMGRGYAWLDTGTHDSLLEASQFIATIEKRQGQKIACLEEIAWNKTWISTADLEQLAIQMKKSTYAEYLLGLIK